MTRLTITTLSLLFSLLIGFTCSAEEPKSIFQSGVKAFEEKKFDEALKYFSESTMLDPSNVSGLINSGLSAMELNKKGEALAYFRKALFVEPTSKEAFQAIQYTMSKLEIKEIPHEIEWYQILRSQFLISNSANGYNFIVLLCLIVFSFLMIRYWGKYKQSVQKAEAPPKFPYIAYLIGIIMVVFLGFLSLKVYDNSLSRGTIIVEKASVRTAPNDQQAILFDIYEGLEVEILMTQNGWIQIQYPGASSGWVPASSLMKTQ